MTDTGQSNIRRRTSNNPMTPPPPPQSPHGILPLDVGCSMLDVGRSARHVICGLALLTIATHTPAASPSEKPRAEAAATDVRASAPITQFSLPLFNDEGQRLSILVAAEARVITPDHITATDMILTRYNPDEGNTIDTTLVSPSAEAFIKEQRVRGDSTVSITRPDFQATGADWSYNHKDQRITIGRDVHLVFKAEIQNILK
ncbi:LPS export ABC transporter periplasmic protein LptC [Geminisphaera colitermitum]|uniref:LPS export ABC transporter periplasmic protein LptC n=1 Tax=Geminisphaera colitermitum TaxID=1148786 RepID=UPI0012FF3FEE|nr:LPS export ABC transporter periplasmic protein LptC [Geminisphaera colitermitum]